MISNSRSCIIITVVIDRKLCREKKAKVYRGNSVVCRTCYEEKKKEGIIVLGQNWRRVSHEGEHTLRRYPDICFLSERSSSENFEKLARKYIWTADGRRRWTTKRFRNARSQWRGKNAPWAQSGGRGLEAPNNANITVKWGSPLASTKTRNKGETSECHVTRRTLSRESSVFQGLDVNERPRSITGDRRDVDFLQLSSNATMTEHWQPHGIFPKSVFFFFLRNARKKSTYDSREKQNRTRL